MSEPDATTATEPSVDPSVDPSVEAAVESTGNWWHRSHPTFAALAGFFSGMLLVTALPGGFAALLRLFLPIETAERLFPLVLVGLLLPVGLLLKRKTRRFGIFMWVGMILTALVVAGVASLVVYLMIYLDGR